MATADIYSATQSYEKILIRKMESEFERHMNRIINRYEQELRDKLVEVASGYTIQLVDEFSDYNLERRLRVEVSWPNDETKEV